MPTKGKAIYLNTFLNTRWFGLMFSYWRADHFDAPRGTAIYSYRSIDNPGNVPAGYKRELFIMRLMYEREIFNGLSMSARGEHLSDFRNKTADYNYSLYLVYKGDFKFRRKQ
jgi:hypothetical protein